ncbi:MAG TPA: 4Fe-4S dicluster domain-containing protein [Clostridia bacterium]|nr:4Fe-4S dicluster domain-containing protein [Clostridia bacterium]
MRLFDTEVQELKYKIIYELVRLELQGKVDRAFYEIPRRIAPGPNATMRCCIYKERAIVQERLKNAMGDGSISDNVVQVIDIACDECPVEHFKVTETCRGCIAHRCLSVCPVGAISFENKKARIDNEKCIECGKCMNACPYKAITENIRPCIRGCKAGAISIDKNKKAVISDEKCIECGACVYNCPFGAITDRSFVLDAIRILRDSDGGKKYKVYAALAPSIVSQFSYAKIEQIVAGLKEMGFHAVVEVALGADMVAAKEAGELAEKGFLTSSCCPSFVKYIEINYPELKRHVSGNVSPMVELSRFIKLTDESAKVIFIGPCISKKSEYRKKELSGIVDCVITFEELQALLDGMDIDVEKLEGQSLDNASYYGRIFARSGGLSEAVTHFVKEENLGIEVNAEVCDGIEQCRIALLKASKGKLDKNFIEGMACEGGCINGAACLHHGLKNRAEVDRYGKQATERKIKDTLLLNRLVDINK